MKLFMTNSDEVFPGLRDTDISDVNVIECIQRTDGEFNAFYGLKHTEEVKQEHSVRMKEWHKNNVHKPNLGVPSWNKGKKWTEEMKQAHSIRMKKWADRHGPTKGFSGKNHTEESKNKISETNKGKTAWNKNGNHSEETKRKIGLKSKGRTPWNKGLTYKLGKK